MNTGNCEWCGGKRKGKRFCCAAHATKYRASLCNPWHLYNTSRGQRPFPKVKKLPGPRNGAY